MSWIIPLVIVGLVVGTGIYAQGRSRVELSWIRSWVGGAFLILLALEAVSLILEL